MDTDPNVFVFFGHGWETFTTSFKEREELEDGFTLVTFSECGMPTRLPDMVPIVQKMTAENLPIISKIATDQSKETKAAIKALLGRDIRVYKKGDKYPDLQYSSLGTFCPPPDAKGRTYTLSVKSGVHKAPLSIPEASKWKYNETVARNRPSGYTLPRTDVEGGEFLKYCSLIPGEDIDTLRKTYEGAVFPDKGSIDTIMEKQKKKRDGTLGEDEDEDIFFPISEVFKKLGPGVYYWPICRGTTEGEVEEVQNAVNNLRSASNAVQEGLGRNRRKTYKKTRRNRRKTYRKKRRY